jgi:pyruvate carboxylase
MGTPVRQLSDIVSCLGGATLESIGLGDQEAVGQPAGYSLQCRITCEDPTKNFQVPRQLMHATSAHV